LCLDKSAFRDDKKSGALSPQPVKLEGNFGRVFSYFHPAIVTTAGDIPVRMNLKRLNILREIVIGDPVPERDPLDGRG
jgi:hypothetical protein